MEREEIISRMLSNTIINGIPDRKATTKEKVTAIFKIFSKSSLDYASIPEIVEFGNKKFNARLYNQLVRKVVDSDPIQFQKIIIGDKIFYTYHDNSRNSKETSLSPETPYGNVKILKDKFLECANHKLFWVDKFFNSKGLDVIYGVINEEHSLKEVIILTSITSEDTRFCYNISEEFRDHFKKLKKELQDKGVNINLKIIDAKTKNLFHDRWLCSSKRGYHFQSINSFFSGAISDILPLSEEMLKKRISEFETWDKDGLDLIDKWGEVKNLIKKTKDNEINSLKNRLNKLNDLKE